MLIVTSKYNQKIHQETVYLPDPSLHTPLAYALPYHPLYSSIWCSIFDKRTFVISS